MHYGLDYDKFELVQTPDQGNNTRFESPVLVELTLIDLCLPCAPQLVVTVLIVAL